jgi:beta-glucosidase/6-phospho-beta-glucosidase/beta-galactosidase
MILPLLLIGLESIAAEPLNIAWGVGTSAYQIEGAHNTHGKGPSVWDKWYSDPSRKDLPNGNDAVEHYKYMKEDISYLGKMKVTAYRFSVSWSRILPDCSGSVNEEGIKFYSEMIDEIIANGATPILTMYHWDTPQACHDKYGSWGNLKGDIVKDFVNYADILFKNYGDRVNTFLTFNEPESEWYLLLTKWPRL